jgi:peptidoglycan hydrolase-like protein with peptidoglycan-binding domain
VREWQRILQGAGHLPAGGIDGVFGPQTESATRAFQRKLGVTADGVVGPQTRAAVDRLFKWLAGSSAKPAHGLSVARTGTRLLRQGVSGSDVREWQRILRHSGRNVTVDGIFGPQTRNATVSFQRQLGVGADGIVGSQTRRAVSRWLS